MTENEKPKAPAAGPDGSDGPSEAVIPAAPSAAPFVPAETKGTPAATAGNPAASASPAGTERAGASGSVHAPAEPPPPQPPRRPGFADRLRERADVPLEIPESKARARTRRDFLLFGAGSVAALSAIWWLLPDETRLDHLTPATRDWMDSLDARLGATDERREKLLDRALTFDDDVAEAIYSRNRTVRTYRRDQATPLRNNYSGATPKPSYIPGWTLAVSGLASGRAERLTAGDLSRFPKREQGTRLCCVEGWSAVAWWGGLRFSDFLDAYPPAADARWAKLESSVNVDGGGNPDPYYVSIDLPTARHPQTLLATELSGKPLPVEHGAPLRLLAPMKLGLKNIKAVTSITYSKEEPADYWNERGYSKYDGL